MRQLSLNREIRAEYERLHAQARFHAEPELYPRVRNHLNAGTRVLDVGCGDGSFLKSLRKIKGVGIDIARTALKKAQTRSTEIKLVQAEAENLPFRPGNFDRVVSLGSLEHFRDIDRALREMVRVLDRAGRVCILVPSSRFIGRPINELRWLFAPGRSQPIERLGSLEEWERLLRRHGLQVIRAEKYNGVRLPLPFNLIFNHLIRPILPLRYSYQFFFTCEPAL